MRVHIGRGKLTRQVRAKEEEKQEEEEEAD